MGRHWELLNHPDFLGRTPIADTSHLIGPLPEITQRFDSEILQGEVNYGSITLKYLPGIEMKDVIEIIRNPAFEIWVEITVEQRITDCPDPKPHEMVFPRKSRCAFWGKLQRKDSNYDIHEEKWLQKQDLFADWDVMAHNGTIDLQFMHWIIAYTNVPATQFLDSIRNGFLIVTDGEYPLSKLLYEAVHFASPTKYFAISDTSLIAKDAKVDGYDSVTRCNFKLPYLFKGDTLSTQQLYNLMIPVRINNLWGALWFKDPAGKDHGAYSFYTKFKTIKDALALLTKEFELKFQVELPMLSETKVSAKQLGSFGNAEIDREKNWLANSRWLFQDVEETVLPIKTRTKRKTIKTTPAASWLQKVDVSEPAPSGIDTTQVHKSLWENDLAEGGASISRSLLFGTITKSWQAPPFPSTLKDNPLGTEFKVFDPDVSPYLEYVRDVDFYSKYYTVTGSWAHVIMNRLIDIWGRVRATIEWQQDFTAIEDFGATNPRVDPKPVGTFKQGDWGDFVLLRYKDGAPGILYPEGESNSHRHSVYDAGRTPGKSAKYKAIERGIGAPIDYSPPPDPEEPDPPPPPPHNEPPVVTIIGPPAVIPQAGTKTVLVNATGAYGVERVKVYVDSTFIGNATHGIGDSWSYSWDTTLHADGDHLLQVRAENDEGSYGYDSRIITIDN